MKKITLLFILMCFTFVFIINDSQAREPVPIEGCGYEHEIKRLKDKIAGMDNQERAYQRAKYVDLVNERGKLDRNTQFQMCADQDGNATLKFNTPEEKLRSNIAKLLSLITWYNTAIGSVATAPVTDKVLTELQDTLGGLQKQIDKVKTKALTDKGNYNKINAEYIRLVNMRKRSMEGLAKLADKYTCRGISPEEMRLGQLYNDEIPYNRGCNVLEKRAFMDNIRRIKTHGFGSIFVKKTFDTLKETCGEKLAAYKDVDPNSPDGPRSMGWTRIKTITNEKNKTHDERPVTPLTTEYWEFKSGRTSLAGEWRREVKEKGVIAWRNYSFKFKEPPARLRTGEKVTITVSGTTRCGGTKGCAGVASTNRVTLNVYTQPAGMYSPKGWLTVYAKKPSNPIKYVFTPPKSSSVKEFYIQFMSGPGHYSNVKWIYRRQ